MQLASQGSRGWHTEIAASPMQVFDKDIERTSARRKWPESAFDYLNRSARPGDEASRSLLETWFQRLPSSEQLELRNRLRCNNDVEFATAFQELFLHELLRAYGCEVVFHPGLPQTAKRPDFLVDPPEGVPFIVEACASTSVSNGPENHPRTNRIRDFLNGLPLHGYRLSIDEIKAGASDLRRASLRTHIESNIQAAPDNKSDVRLPEFTTQDGWIIRLTANRVEYELEPGASTIQLEAFSRTWTGPSYPLRDVLKGKVGKYGELPMPYVIALNSFDGMLTTCHLEETLFGVRPDTQIAGMTPKLARGLWGSEQQPTSRRVSAVIFTINLWPQTVVTGQVYCSLWLNPWANRPYEGFLEELPAFRLENGEIQESPGRQWHEIMGFEDLLDSSAFV